MHTPICVARDILVHALHPDFETCTAVRQHGTQMGPQTIVGAGLNGKTNALDLALLGESGQNESSLRISISQKENGTGNKKSNTAATIKTTTVTATVTTTETPTGTLT